jgi:hypothetical protein
LTAKTVQQRIRFASIANQLLASIQSIFGYSKIDTKIDISCRELVIPTGFRPITAIAAVI